MVGFGDVRLAEQAAVDALKDEIPVPNGSNAGLVCPDASFLRKKLGEPRPDYNQHCQSLTNKTLKDMMSTTQVRGVNVWGLSKAVDSLKLVLADIQKEQPLVYSVLGTAGMGCCRKQRPKKGQDGSQVKAISAHSWGTAIDLTVAKKLDVRGNGTCMRGMALMAPIFHRYGWFWGATFRTEDAMHFEVSKAKLTEWFPKDLYDHKKDPAPDLTLRFGSHGELVKALQKRLKEVTDRTIVPDGKFGKQTEAAVKLYQTANPALTPDGIVGPKTRKAMGL